MQVNFAQTAPFYIIYFAVLIAKEYKLAPYSSLPTSPHLTCFLTLCEAK